MPSPDRRTYIGSSDAAAILGMSPWRSAGDVWLEKTGRLDAGDGGNASTRRGSLLEDAVLGWAEQELGVAIRGRQRHFLHLSVEHVGATIDGILQRDERFELVEAKTARDRREWGEAGSDEIPDHYKIQVQHAMAVIGCEVAHVPVLFGDLTFAMFRVERDDALASHIVGECGVFWHKHVAADVAPDDFQPSLDVARRMRREPGKSVHLPDVAVAAYEQAKRRAKAAADDLDRVQAELLVALGDAEAFTTDAGHSGTYLEQTRKSLDAKAIERDHPDLVADYRRQTSYRVLRVKPAKEQSHE